MVTVKATRDQREWQYSLTATLLPCRRDHPRAEAVKLRLMIDTGSARTDVRRQVVKNVKATNTQRIYGVGGHSIPAAEIRAHFIFPGEQFLTTKVLLIDARNSDEDGLLGLDLIRGMQMRNGVAEVTLATSDERAGKGRLHDTIERIEERWELEDCGCLADVEGASRKVRAVGVG